MSGRRWIPLLLFLAAAAVAWWRLPSSSSPPSKRHDPSAAREGSRPGSTLPSSPATTAEPRRDLAEDDRAGGHTLRRHVDRSDDDLRRRLREEPGIAAASTFDDRATAERVAGATIERERGRIDRWLASGHGNLALDFRGPRGEPVGRVLVRGEREPRPSADARVVLARRGETFFVLTAYPLEPR